MCVKLWRPHRHCVLTKYLVKALNIFTISSVNFDPFLELNVTQYKMLNSYTANHSHIFSLNSSELQILQQDTTRANHINVHIDYTCILGGFADFLLLPSSFLRYFDLILFCACGLKKN